MTERNRIREHRKASGLTLQCLAEKVGSSKSYMWQLENTPDPNPGVKLGIKLARAFGTTVEEFFKGGMLRCGDHVRHIPSGEVWVVAWADDKKLCAAGWPETIVDVDSCVCIKRSTETEHLSAIFDWRKSSGSSRREAVRRMHPQSWAASEALENSTEPDLPEGE